MFDYSKLLGRIKEICGTQKEFADRIGMSLTAVNERLRNKRDFTCTDICRACEVLFIPHEEIPAYFFVLKVQNTNYQPMS